MADPGAYVLHRALRTAIALPLANILTISVLGVRAGALYCSFSSLSLLLFADFRGPMRHRVVAYLAAGAGGAAAIVLGHLVAPYSLLAAAVGCLVGAVIAFVTLLRGYIGAGASTVQLGFILAATAGPQAQLSAQMTGWLVGTLVATVAAVTLWPARRSSQLRLAVAGTVRAAADLVEARWVRGAITVEMTDFRARYRELRRMYEGKINRPGGGTSRDRALVELIDELQRLRSLLSWRSESPDPPTELDRVLAREIENVLRQSADCLAGLGGAPHPDALAEARDEHFQGAVLHAADELGRGDIPEMIERVEGSFPLRLAAISTQFVAADTRGAVLLPREVVRSAEGIALPSTIWESGPFSMLRANTTLSSPWFRNGVRAGLGLGLAVLIALVSGRESAFWVVLGTLSVLRFDALGTGRTAAQAVVGTLGGCLLGTALAELIGPHPMVLWLVLPFVVFAAAYTPTTTSFVVAQGAISMFLIILATISSGLSPTSTGLTRFTDIALGAAVSVVVGALLWPRGVRAQVRSTLAESLGRAGDYALAMTDRLAAGLSGEPQAPLPRAERSLAVHAAARADDAVDLAAATGGPEPVNALRWARVASSGHHFIEAADVMGALGDPPPRGPGTDNVARAIRGLAERTVGQLGEIEATLLDEPLDDSRSEIPPLPTTIDQSDLLVAAVRNAVHEALGSWVTDRSRGPESGVRASSAVDPVMAMTATRLIWAAQWQVYMAWSAQIAATAA